MYYLLILQTEKAINEITLNFSSENDFNLGKSKILPSGRVNPLPNNPRFDSLPNDTFFDWPKLKALSDDKINVTEKLKFVYGRAENIMGKGENADYQHFLPFPQYF